MAAGSSNDHLGERLDGAPVTVNERDEQLHELHRRVFSKEGGKDTDSPAQEGRFAQDPTAQVTQARPIPARLPKSDDEIIRCANAARNGAKFSRLWAGDCSGYPSPSEATLALCAILAFYTSDRDQIKRLVTRSGLRREKLDRARGRRNWLDIVIDKAALEQVAFTTKQGGFPDTVRSSLEDDEYPPKEGVNDDTVGNYSHTPPTVDISVSAFPTCTGGDWEGQALRVVMESLPPSKDLWREYLFRLARRLKGVPCVCAASGETLTELVGLWFEAAGPALRSVPIREVRQAFRSAWEGVRFPAGTSPFERLLRRAKEQTAGEQVGHRRPEFAVLAAVCRLIQERVGRDGTFFLACRTVADLLGIDYRLAANWLGVLCRLGILKVVRRGNWRRGMASEYRYDLTSTLPCSPVRVQRESHLPNERKGS